MAKSKWHIQVLLPAGLTVLVGICVWVIRNEGDKNRHAVADAGDRVKQELSDAPDQVVSNVFRLAQEFSKLADDVGQEVLALSVEEEREIGAQLFQHIRKQHKVLPPGVQAVRLNRLATPLLQKCKREGITYTFSVLQSDEINAFSHGGGYIYINTGLLEFVGSDAELEFVLGHEIGHVDLKHCTRNLTYASRASELGGELGRDLVMISYHLVSVGYSEEQEFEADEWAYRRLRELGRSEKQALALPRHFMDKERQEAGQKEKTKAKASPATDVVQEINNHFRTHPDTAERLKRLKQLGFKSPGRRGSGE